MPQNVSALPSAMQDRRKELEGNEEVAKPEANPEAKPEAKPEASNVTISRDEFNDLQAAAGRVKAAEGRSEALKDDVEALTRRLTDLETAAKGISQAAPAPSENTYNAKAVEFSEQDLEDYGESKPFVRKVVQEILNEELPQLIKALESKLSSIKEVAEGASKIASSVRSKSYTDKVRDEVKNFDGCVNHKYWPDFTESTDPDTGYSYRELIESNINRENVPGMVRVFNKFKEKFGVGTQVPSGYEGAVPNEGAAPVDPGSGEQEALPFSARKEAHKKFINKEMSFEEYSKIKDKFDKADREGRIDYNK